MKYSITEVSVNDTNSMKLFGYFYNHIYVKSFPDINKRESLENIVDFLTKKQNKLYGNNNYHILIIHDDINIMGGIIFDYFSNSNSGVIEFICIEENFKRKGLATILYNKAINMINEDARKISYTNVDFIFCEIDDVNNQTTDPSFIHFWKNKGFKKLEFKYIQPSLSVEKTDVDNLNLTVKILFKGKVSYIHKLDILNFLFDYATFGMNIINPEKNSAIAKMIKNIPIRVYLTDIV